MTLLAKLWSFDKTLKFWILFQRYYQKKKQSINNMLRVTMFPEELVAMVGAALSYLPGAPVTTYLSLTAPGGPRPRVTVFSPGVPGVLTTQNTHSTTIRNWNDTAGCMIIPDASPPEQLSPFQAGWQGPWSCSTQCQINIGLPQV